MSYWLNEFLVVVVGSFLAGVLLLAVQRNVEGRRRVTLEIQPATIGSRLGFRLTPRNGAIYHPVVLYTRWPQFSTFESQRLDLYDIKGDSYDPGYVQAGVSVFVFPFVAKHSWGKKGESNVLEVEVENATTREPAASQGFEGITLKSKRVQNLTSRGRMPWDATLRIHAEGLNKEIVQTFTLYVDAMAYSQYGGTNVEDFELYYELNGEKVTIKG
jgi:hypothetical protein